MKGIAFVRIAFVAGVLLALAPMANAMHLLPLADAAATGNPGAHLPEYYWSDLLVLFITGLVVILLLNLAYWVWNKLTPNCDFDKALTNNVYSVAIVLSSYFLVIGLILATLIKTIFGG